jgi:quercetin dioxygenase-like cupin family protein
MRITPGSTSIAAVIVCTIVITIRLAPAAAGVGQPASPSQSRIALSRTLPPMDGREIRVKVVEVAYAPGGANASHTHPCPVIGYVLQGALRMRVNDGPETIFRAGESFYEGAGDIHQTSANASTTEPARFLASFVCDRDVAQLSSPTATPKGREKGR